MARPGWGEFDGDVPDVARTNYSLSAVEFARVFDRAGGLRLATAARMSAALPMFTPAVYLPSDPPLRIIDSGYFDNYGIDVSAASAVSEPRLDQATDVGRDPCAGPRDGAA